MPVERRKVKVWDSDGIHQIEKYALVDTDTGRFLSVPDEAINDSLLSPNSLVTGYDIKAMSRDFFAKNFPTDPKYTKSEAFWHKKDRELEKSQEEINRYLSTGEKPQSPSALRAWAYLREKFPKQAGWVLQPGEMVSESVARANGKTIEEFGRVAAKAVNTVTGEVQLIDLDNTVARKARDTAYLARLESMYIQSHPNEQVTGTWRLTTSLSATTPWLQSTGAKQERIDEIYGSGFFQKHITNLDREQLAKVHLDDTNRFFKKAAPGQELFGEHCQIDAETDNFGNVISVSAKKFAYDSAGQLLLVDTFEKYYYGDKNGLGTGAAQATHGYDLNQIGKLQRLAGQRVGVKYDEKAQRELSKFVGKATLVGHNIDGVDGDIHWLFGKEAEAMRANGVVDTFQIAKSFRQQGTNSAETLFFAAQNVSSAQFGLRHHWAASDTTQQEYIVEGMRRAQNQMGSVTQALLVNKGWRLIPAEFGGFSGSYAIDEFSEVFENVATGKKATIGQFLEMSKQAGWKLPKALEVQTGFTNTKVTEQISPELVAKYQLSSLSTNEELVSGTRTSQFIPAQSTIDEEDYRQYNQKNRPNAIGDTGIDAGLTGAGVDTAELTGFGFDDEGFSIPEPGFSAPTVPQVPQIPKIDIKTGQERIVPVDIGGDTMDTVSVQTMQNLADAVNAMNKQTVAQGRITQDAVKNLIEQGDMTKAMQDRSRIEKMVSYLSTSGAEMDKWEDTLAERFTGAGDAGLFKTAIEQAGASYRTSIKWRTGYEKYRTARVAAESAGQGPVNLYDEPAGNKYTDVADPRHPYAHLPGRMQGMYRNIGRDAGIYVAPKTAEEHEAEMMRAGLKEFNQHITASVKEISAFSTALKAVPGLIEKGFGYKPGSFEADAIHATNDINRAGSAAFGSIWSPMNHLGAALNDGLSYTQYQKEQIANKWGAIGSGINTAGQALTKLPGAAGALGFGLQAAAPFVQSIGTWRETGETPWSQKRNRDLLKGMQFEATHNLDLLAFALDPLKKAAGIFSKIPNIALRIYNYFLKGMGYLQNLGNPLTGLTGVDYQGYQRSVGADRMAGLSRGSTNATYEGFAQAQANLYTLGQLDTNRLVSAALLGSFGEAYANGGDTEAQYGKMVENVAGRVAQGGLTARNALAYANNIDKQMAGQAQMLARMREYTGNANLSYRQMNDARTYGGYYYGLTNGQTNQMYAARNTWGSAVESFQNILMKSAVGIWDNWGKTMTNGLARSLNGIADKLLAGDFAGAWDSLKESVGGLWDNIKEKLAGGWDTVAGTIFDKVKQSVAGLWNTVAPVLADAFSRLLPLIETGLDAIYDIWGKTMQLIAQSVAGVWDSLSDIQIDPLALLPSDVRERFHITGHDELVYSKRGREAGEILSADIGSQERLNSALWTTSGNNALFTFTDNPEGRQAAMDAFRRGDMATRGLNIDETIAAFDPGALRRNINGYGSAHSVVNAYGNFADLMAHGITPGNADLLTAAGANLDNALGVRGSYTGAAIFNELLTRMDSAGNSWQAAKTLEATINKAGGWNSREGQIIADYFGTDKAELTDYIKNNRPDNVMDRLADSIPGMTEQMKNIMHQLFEGFAERFPEIANRLQVQVEVNQDGQVTGVTVNGEDIVDGGAGDTHRYNVRDITFGGWRGMVHATQLVAEG